MIYVTHYFIKNYEKSSANLKDVWVSTACYLFSFTLPFSISEIPLTFQVFTWIFHLLLIAWPASFFSWTWITLFLVSFCLLWVPKFISPAIIFTSYLWSTTPANLWSLHFFHQANKCIFHWFNSNPLTCLCIWLTLKNSISNSDWVIIPLSSLVLPILAKHTSQVVCTCYSHLRMTTADARISIHVDESVNVSGQVVPMFPPINGQGGTGLHIQLTL